MKKIEDILETLVSFRTISEDKEENKKALDWVASQLPSSMYVVRHESNGFHSLVATTRKTKSPILWLAMHIDVVPGSDAVFTMRKSTGTLLGRGVFDMKFAFALYIAFLQEKKDVLQDYDLGLVITADEEIAGKNGVKYLMDQGYGGKVVFLPDGGENWKIQSTAKGCMRLKVTATGKNAHGSRPWEGSNANRTLLHFLCDMHTLFEEEVDDAEHHHNTMNVGKMQGGEVINQVADYAEAFVDVRYIPEVPRNLVMENLGALNKRYPNISIEELMHLPAYQTDLNTPEVIAWADIARDEYGIATEPIHAHGGSDANHFADNGMNVILVRPHGGGQHAEDEWIDREGLKKFYQVLVRWIGVIAGTNVR